MQINHLTKTGIPDTPDTMEHSDFLSQKVAKACALAITCLAVFIFYTDIIAHPPASYTSFGEEAETVAATNQIDANIKADANNHGDANNKTDANNQIDANSMTASSYQGLSQKEALSVDDLLSWSKWGNGYFGNFRNRAVQMTEDPHSEGIMLVSPKSYERDVVVTFDVMTLRPATVLVFMHSISDGTGSGTLAIPPGFDGAMSGWPQNASSYFFAFHNAPHFRHPFVNRWGPDGVKLLQEAGQNYMSTGKWHSVEVGRSGGRLWLQIDGEMVLDVTDPDPFGAGHLAFRIRGSGTERASCFIKDVVIRSKMP